LVVFFERPELRYNHLVVNVSKTRGGNLLEPAFIIDTVILAICCSEEDEEVYLVALILGKAFEQEADSVSNILFL
jgi:hypothetical protein